MDPETAAATPRSPVSASITMRGHTVIQDKPEAYGGQDEGPMASEFLLVSLLSCQLSTLAKVAVKRRLDVKVANLDGELHFNDAGDIERIELVFRLASEADDKALATLVRLTDKACTISRALSVPVETLIERA